MTQAEWMVQTPMCDWHREVFAAVDRLQEKSIDEYERGRYSAAREMLLQGQHFLNVVGPKNMAVTRN